MSSSRDHSTLTGWPTSLAISTASGTKSCVDAAPAEAAAEHGLVDDDVAAAACRRACAAAASAASPFCVGAQISDARRRSTCAVQFCGSMRGVGEERHLVVGLDAPRRPARSRRRRRRARVRRRRRRREAGAQELADARRSRPCRCRRRPSRCRAHRRAFFACHQSSATTATASLSFTTLRTPFMPASLRIRRPTSACP